MTTDELLDALGGTGAVASRLELDKSTVSGWRVRGIPPGRWREIVSLAASDRLNGITFDLLARLENEREVAGAAK